jgi:hypothetical protein
VEGWRTLSRAEWLRLSNAARAGWIGWLAGLNMVAILFSNTSVLVANNLVKWPDPIKVAVGAALVLATAALAFAIGQNFIRLALEKRYQRRYDVWLAKSVPVLARGEAKFTSTMIVGNFVEVVKSIRETSRKAG